MLFVNDKVDGLGVKLRMQLPVGGSFEQGFEFRMLDIEYGDAAAIGLVNEGGEVVEELSGFIDGSGLGEEALPDVDDEQAVVVGFRLFMVGSLLDEGEDKHVAIIWVCLILGDMLALLEVGGNIYSGKVDGRRLLRLRISLRVCSAGNAPGQRQELKG